MRRRRGRDTWLTGARPLRRKGEAQLGCPHCGSGDIRAILPPTEEETCPTGAQYRCMECNSRFRV